MIRAVIVDDEENARVNLQLLIERYCKDIDIIGTADSALTGIKLIQKEKPNLVFLDVQMPHGSGFDLLEGLENRNFQLVFTTAQLNHAIKAIHFSALDYLIKPLDHNELIDAVKRVKEKLSFDHEKNNNNLLQHLKAPSIDKVAFPTSTGYKYVFIDDIIYLKGDGSYINIFTKNGETFLVSKNLKIYEDLLSKHAFYRSHISYLVNLKCVESFDRVDGTVITLTNGAKTPLSPGKKDGFISVMNTL